MENIERHRFYEWLAHANWDGPVGLTAKFTVEPDRVDAFLDIMSENIAFTRQEEGCLQYDLTPCHEREDVFFLLERFQSRSALLSHVKSAHYAACQQRFIADMGAHPQVQICFYRVNPIQPKSEHAARAVREGHIAARDGAHLTMDDSGVQRDSSPGAVPAEMFYRAPSRQALVANPYAPGGLAVNAKAGAVVGVRVHIRDARAEADAGAATPAHFSGRGFGVAAVRPIGRGDAEMRRWAADAEQLARELTGAPVSAAAGDCVLRAPNSSGGRGAGFYVHNDFADEGEGDYTGGFGPQLARHLDSGSDAATTLPSRLRGKGITPAALRRGRIVVLNLWRHLNAGPLYRTPLAVCDARSLTRGDLSTYEYHPNPVPPGYGLPVPNLLTQACPRDEHRWYYFPGLRADEAIAFKTFDSVGVAPQNGVGVHAAFENPLAPSSAPPRESVECRIICAWPALESAPAALPALGAGRVKSAL